MNVEPRRLKRDTAPTVCAATGRPTTLRWHHFLWHMPHVNWWWYFFWGPPNVLFYRLVIGRGTHVVLPIAREVRTRVAVVTALRVASVIFPFVVFLTAIGDSVMSPARTATMFGSIVVSLVLFRRTRRYWVRPRYDGANVVLRDPHPDFRAAVRGLEPGGEPFRLPQVQAFLADEVEVAVADPDRPQFGSDPKPVATGPVPGWYPDPSGQHAVRYYDGAQWTQQVA